MEDLLEVLKQINNSLQPSFFDYFTLFIAFISLFLSIRTIRKENLSRTFEAIPVLLLNYDTIFGDYLIYDAKNPEKDPIYLEINNYSNASAYNIKIQFNPDFNKLINEDFLSKYDDNTFKENTAYRMNTINFTDGNAFFSIKESKTNPRLFYDDIVIKREALSGNSSTSLSQTELMQINDLINSYTCFSFKETKSLKLPLSIKISYTNISGKEFQTDYDLLISNAGIEEIGVNNPNLSDTGLEISKFKYQVQNKSMFSSALKERKKYA